MRISQDFLASLREQVSLSSVIGHFVSWDRRKSQPGKGDLWACCPFHEEKSPSFHVDDRKGFYHCFGCHQSGDHVSFLMDHQGLPFIDAVKVLANAAGVPMPEGSAAETNRERGRQRQRSALDAAAALYESTLWAPAGRTALDYAASRGFSRQTLEKFGFGLAPSVQGFLARQLQSEGFREADLESVGLVVKGDRGGLRDRFRGRLMVPIHDGRGRLVGFGGRSLDGREPKYLNSPETPLFDKSSLLYNAHRARGVAHRSNRLFVVEGYLDAVALAEAGIEEVVASLGTALTENQIKLAWDLADEPILCFDGDKAGQAAARRALERIVPLLSPGRSFQLLALPEGKDPDDVVRAGGREAFEALAAGAVPLVDAIFAHECERGVDTPERLAALEQRLEAVAASIPDTRVAAHYRSALRDRFFALRRRSAPAGNTGRPRRPQAAPTPPSARFPAPADTANALIDLERIVLGLLIRHPFLIDAFGERLTSTHFASEAHQGLAAMILEAYAATLAEEPLDLLEHLPQRARMCLNEVWGEPTDSTGTRLIGRFAVLTCNPDPIFVRQCLDVFLMKLDLREQAAELSAGSTRWIDGDDAAHQRLLSLSAAMDAQRTVLAEAERALADEANLLRRRKAQGDTGRPGTNSFDP